MGYGIWVNSILLLKGTVLSPTLLLVQCLRSQCAYNNLQTKVSLYTDRLRFTRNTKIVLNTSCSKYSIQGEAEPRRRVPWCSLPKLGDDDPLNPSLTADPLLLCVRGKKEPQMIVTHTFIQRAKPMMMYTNDARTVSLNVGCHHGLWVQEQLAGDGWWETRYARSP